MGPRSRSNPSAEPVLLSDAEREELFEALSRHAAAGRLDVNQLEDRVAALDAAQTREQADAVLADLPRLEPAADVSAGTTMQRWPRWGRGHGESDAPAPGWTPTNERFRDPKTGNVMRVWVDGDGGRHYVVDNAP
jgi:DUF1707 SHOCT-like domain